MVLLANSLIFLVFYALKITANMSGIMYDPTDKTLSFPGGGKQADNIVESVSPTFWIQSIFRYSVRVDQISSIRTDFDFTDGTEITPDKYTYYLIIYGAFGAYKIIFDNEAKRNELYSLIREVNNMGYPVVNV